MSEWYGEVYPIPFGHITLVCDLCGAELVQEANSEGLTEPTLHDCTAGTWEIDA